MMQPSKRSKSGPQDIDIHRRVEEEIDAIVSEWLPRLNLRDWKFTVKFDEKDALADALGVSVDEIFPGVGGRAHA